MYAILYYSDKYWFLGSKQKEDGILQDKFANSYGIYEENIGKKLKSEQKNVFICYRGMYSWGGAIAQVLYYTILCSRFSELIPFCAPQNKIYGCA